MAVPMVDIGEMFVAVAQGRMAVRMVVRLRAVPVERVDMLVVRVMHVGMCMLKSRMPVFVRVVLGQVHPYAESHQRAGQPKAGRRCFTWQ